MIPPDCIPTGKETVMEILSGPDKDNRCVFFLYWIGHGYFTGVRGQIFKTQLSAHIQGKRIVDRRNGQQ